MKKPILVVRSDVLAKAHVNDFTRKDGTVVHAHDTKTAAAAPHFGTHHEVLRKQAEKMPEDGGNEDRYRLLAAADHMKNKDHEALKRTVGTADTWQREQILEHIHPDHWSGLGAEPNGKERAVKEFHKKFGEPKAAAPKKAVVKKEAAKPAPFQHAKHADIKEGDVLEDEHGNTHEFSHFERGLGRKLATMRSGHQYPTKGDELPGFKKKA